MPKKIWRGKLKDDGAGEERGDASGGSGVGTTVGFKPLVEGKGMVLGVEGWGMGTGEGMMESV